MIRIGLTYTGTEEKHRNYLRWLQGDGGDAVEVVRLSVKDDNLEELRRCDGLVLTGGVDIDPVLYGGDLRYAGLPSNWERDRDVFEQSALEMAWKEGLPVLGVCRGLQLINVVLKGGLMQDLGNGDAVHTGEAGVDRQHGVTIFWGTLLSEITAREDGVANSAHHQAIGRLGEGLAVNCVAEDGVIEGIEWAEREGKAFMLAVQWHPERMYRDGMSDTWLYRAVRDRFADEIKNR